MACGEVTIHGVKGRLFRISFSGEHAYEIAIPSRYGEALYRDLVARAETLGGGAYGMEALNVLRLEKGFITHSEIHGRVTADDVGHGPHGVGQEGLHRQDGLQRPGPVGRAPRAAGGPETEGPGTGAAGRWRTCSARRCRDAGQRPGLHHLGRVVADDGDPYRPRLPAERTRAASGRRCAWSTICAKRPRSARSATRSSSIPREDAPVANLIARTPFDGHLPLIHGTVEAVEVDVGPSPPSRPSPVRRRRCRRRWKRRWAAPCRPLERSVRKGATRIAGAGWTSGSSWARAGHDPGRGAHRPKRRLGVGQGRPEPDRGTC
jgi:hypothetical protein